MEDDFGRNDPLSIIISFLEKNNEDQLASKVLDVFAKNCFNIENWNMLAKLYLDVRDAPKAEAAALMVLSLCETEEQRYNARANLAKMYNNLNEPTKSMHFTNQNLKIAPNEPESLMENVFSLYLLNRKIEGRKILDSLKVRENEFEERHRDIINFNLGTYLLEDGEFHEGLKKWMLKGQKLKLWFNYRELPLKFWDGGLFPGKTLVLFAEGGGIGDEMLSVRFMDDLKNLGFKPIFHTSRKDMYNLFNQCGYETVMNLDTVPKDALWTYFMQVPVHLKMNPEDVMRVKYLYPSEASRKKWEHIKDFSGLKIGVRWQGNSKNERDLHRKVPLDDIMKTLREVYKDKNVKFYSLQIGDGAEEIVKYPELLDVSNKINSYDDTLGLLENLDVVVTSCTSVLHASAIVGTKTLGLIPISAYFTWVSPAPENQSIWYPENLKIFKQTKHKCWKDPLEEMKRYLP